MCFFTKGLQLRANGELHTYRNGHHIEKVASGLPTRNTTLHQKEDEKFYAFVDVYGSITKVSIVAEADGKLGF